MTDNEPIFTVQLRAEPGHTAPAIVRLRRALKTLLRSFGLRALQVQEAPAPSPSRMWKRRAKKGSRPSGTGEAP